MSKKIRVLSLFDGIGIAQQALKELEIKAEYYASEIEMRAIAITQRNHPDTIQLGDVEGVQAEMFKGKEIDLIIGGSPCQDLSIAKGGSRQGLSGERSGLFWEYVRTLKELTPKFFVLENVASMPKEAKETITATLWGIEPVMLDASYFSAQRRKRLFWVGRRENGRYNRVKIPAPGDKKIYLKDILENEADITEKKTYLSESLSNAINETIINKLARGHFFNGKPVPVGSIGGGGQGQVIYSVDGKALPAMVSRARGLYLIQQTKTVSTNDYYRFLSAVENERLQSLPDGYTAGETKTFRQAVLGNGFNCAIIKHILNNLFSGN